MRRVTHIVVVKSVTGHRTHLSARSEVEALRVASTLLRLSTTDWVTCHPAILFNALRTQALTVSTYTPQLPYQSDDEGEWQ